MRQGFSKIFLLFFLDQIFDSYSTTKDVYEEIGQPIVLFAMDGYNGKYVLSDLSDITFNFFFCGILSIDHCVKMLLCNVNIAKWIFLAIFSRVATVREK